MALEQPLYNQYTLGLNDLSSFQTNPFNFQYPPLPQINNGVNYGQFNSNFNNFNPNPLFPQQQTQSTNPQQPNSNFNQFNPTPGFAIGQQPIQYEPRQNTTLQFQDNYDNNGLQFQQHYNSPEQMMQDARQDVNSKNKPQSQQQDNYDKWLYAMYGHPYIGAQSFNAKLGSALAFEPQDRGDRALRGIQIGASALGSALGNAREIFGAFAASKRNQYLQQRDAENRRDGMLSNPYGQQETFNNGWQQRGVLNFIGDGGKVGDVLDLDEITIKKMEREGYVFERV